MKSVFYAASGIFPFYLIFVCACLGVSLSLRPSVGAVTFTKYPPDFFIWTLRHLIVTEISCGKVWHAELSAVKLERLLADHPFLHRLQCYLVLKTFPLDSGHGFRAPCSTVGDVNCNSYNQKSSLSFLCRFVEWLNTILPANDSSFFHRFNWSIDWLNTWSTDWSIDWLID